MKPAMKLLFMRLFAQYNKWGCLPSPPLLFHRMPCPGRLWRRGSCDIIAGPTLSERCYRYQAMDTQASSRSIVGRAQRYFPILIAVDEHQRRSAPGIPPPHRFKFCFLKYEDAGGPGDGPLEEESKCTIEKPLSRRLQRPFDYVWTRGPDCVLLLKYRIATQIIIETRLDVPADDQTPSPLNSTSTRIKPSGRGRGDARLAEHQWCIREDRFDSLRSSMGAQQSSAARPGAPANGDCPAAHDTSSSGCPVPESVRSKAIYNVYNQRIDKAKSESEPGNSPFVDPRNNMPASANQQPYPGQRVLLPIDRVQSTIPKGGTDSTWEYPSPQMFYNALKRKGKGEGIPDSEGGNDGDLSGVMESVVLTHNSLNEMTWQAIQKWESLHPEKRVEVKLTRFIGRPHDTSPLAWMHQMMGGPAPFDRHDWYILRDGKEIRYVIDFYFDESQAGSSQAFTVSERPALDSFENGIDRVRMAVYTQCAKWGVPCPVTGQGHSE